MLVGERIVVNEDIYLKQLNRENTEELFELTEKNQNFLIPWFEWATELSLKATGLFISSSYNKNKKRKGCDLGIFYGNKLVGVIALMHYNKIIKSGAEIAYWLSNDCCGKGIMTKVVRKIEEYCFTKLNFDKVYIIALPENLPSRSIPEKLDFDIVDADIEPTEINHKKSYYIYYVKTQSKYKGNFWNYLNTLIETSKLTIYSKKDEFNDYLNIVNPVDFGYLKNDWEDDNQVDVFFGSIENNRVVDHIICALDFKNKFSDIKILYGCTTEEKNIIFSKLSEKEGVLLVPNPKYQEEDRF